MMYYPVFQTIFIGNYLSKSYIFILNPDYMYDLSARYNLPRTPCPFCIAEIRCPAKSGIVAPADGYIQMKIYLLIHR